MARMNKTGKHICNPRLPEAHAINNQPWQPLPGQVKKFCPNCEFWYATARRGQEICHDCEDKARKGRVYGALRVPLP